MPYSEGEFKLVNINGETVGTVKCHLVYARRLASMIATENKEVEGNQWLTMTPDPMGVDPASDGWININDELPNLGKEVEVLDLGSSRTALLMRFKGRSGNHFVAKDRKKYVWYADKEMVYAGQSAITHWRPIATS